MAASFYDWDADAYAAARPTYPAALFDALAARCPRREWAWDCAAGNGQATAGLQRDFEHVVATDLSFGQLAAWPAGLAVDRLQASAEAPPFRDAVFDLVCVAQAMHWFAHAEFFAAVGRVAAGGLLAAWNYGVPRIDDEFDPEIDRFYDGVVGPYWPPERRHIDNDYRDIVFPFARREHLLLSIERDWTLEQFLAYLDTWSAVRRYRDARGADPLPALAQRLAPRWGSGPRRVHWPLPVHLFQVR